METKHVGIDTGEYRGWQTIGQTGSWRRHVVKTALNTEIVKISSAVTSGPQRKHVLLASVHFFSLAFPSKLCLNLSFFGFISFP